MASGRIELAPLLTHRYPLERVAEAIEATRGGITPKRVPYGFKLFDAKV